jgi:hypothetical protein
MQCSEWRPEEVAANPVVDVVEAARRRETEAGTNEEGGKGII